MLARMKSSAAQWGERVRDWEASGQSAEEFARGKPFTGKMLRWWRGEFERRRRAPSRPGVAMARVVRPGEAVVDDGDDAAIAIVVGRFRVEVDRGFDEALLRDVLRVVGTSQ